MAPRPRRLRREKQDPVARRDAGKEEKRKTRPVARCWGRREEKKAPASHPIPSSTTMPPDQKQQWLRSEPTQCDECRGDATKPQPHPSPHGPNLIWWSRMRPKSKTPRCGGYPNNGTLARADEKRTCRIHQMTCKQRTLRRRCGWETAHGWNRPVAVACEGNRTLRLVVHHYYYDHDVVRRTVSRARALGPSLSRPPESL